MGLRSWGDTEGSEFWEDVTKERFLRIFVFWFFVVLWLECWCVCRRVWSVWLKKKCHSVQEVKPRGTNHRVQEPSCALQVGWSEWCPVPALGAALVHPGLVGLMLWGVVCVILKAGITALKRICVPWCSVDCFVVWFSVSRQFIPEPQVRLLSLSRVQGKIEAWMGRSRRQQNTAGSSFAT